MSSSWPMLTRFLSPPLMPFLKKPPALHCNGDHLCGGKLVALSCVGPGQLLLASGSVTLLLQSVAAWCMQLAQDTEGQTSHTPFRHDACFG